MAPGKILVSFPCMAEGFYHSHLTFVYGHCQRKTALCSRLLQWSYAAIPTPFFCILPKKLSAKLNDQCNGKTILRLFFLVQLFLCRTTSQSFWSATQPGGNRDLSLAKKVTSANKTLKYSHAQLLDEYH